MAPSQKSGWTKLLGAWNRQQVSYYGGKYSIERVFALENYTRRTSLIRALVVCIWTPLPVAGLVICLEALPLQDPRDGWQANYGFWIRVAVVVFLIAYTSTRQAVDFIDGLKISARQLINLCSGISILFTVCTVVISANVVFPLPFLVLVLTPVYNVIHIILFRVIMGIQMCRRLVAQRGQLIQYMNFLHALILMMFGYPAYEVLFRFVQGSRYQLPVILLLPMIKVIIKKTVLKCTMHVQDLTPELVIFTVDFFNAIYVATCMQSATSASTIVAIAVTDLSQTISMLYGLHRRTNGILARFDGSPDTVAERGNLLSELCALCRDTDIFGKQSRVGVKIFSSFPVRISVEDAIFLETLNLASKIPIIPDISCPKKTKKLVLGCCGSNAVRPDLAEKTQPTEHPSPIHSVSLTDEPLFLQHSLETFFTIECLIVTAYLEIIIPFFYPAYIFVMVYLPSAKYHSEMAGVTRENVSSTILPVFVLGLLQLVSVSMLVAVVKGNCRVQALYQLAFVLESRMWSIQSKLMVWMLITLSFRLVHFGIDFTFKFAGLGWAN